MTPLRVLFFGDDVMAATEDPSYLGIVGRLLVRAREAGQQVIGYNLGVVGDTSLAVSRRWRKEAAPRVSPSEDWRPVFCVGTSDVETVGHRTRLDKSSSTKAMQKIAVRTGELGLAALVIGPVPLGPRDQQQRVIALSHAYSDLCTHYGIPYCETATALATSERWNADLATYGGRPRESAYEEFARAVTVPWLDWLERRNR